MLPKEKDSTKQDHTATESMDTSDNSTSVKTYKDSEKVAESSGSSSIQARIQRLLGPAKPPDTKQKESIEEEDSRRENIDKEDTNPAITDSKTIDIAQSKVSKPENSSAETCMDMETQEGKMIFKYFFIHVFGYVQLIILKVRCEHIWTQSGRWYFWFKSNWDRRTLHDKFSLFGVQTHDH